MNKRLPFAKINLTLFFEILGYDCIIANSSESEQSSAKCSCRMFRDECLLAERLHSSAWGKMQWRSSCLPWRSRDHLKNVVKFTLARSLVKKLLSFVGHLSLVAICMALERG